MIRRSVRRAFEEWVHAQWPGDPPKHLNRGVAYLADYDEDGKLHYGHHVLGALAVSADGPSEASAPFVLLHTIHEEDVFPDEDSRRAFLGCAKGVSVNSPAQARALVRALVDAFGEDALPRNLRLELREAERIARQFRESCSLDPDEAAAVHREVERLAEKHSKKPSEGKP